jgi:hypothetical protein
MKNAIPFAAVVLGLLLLIASTFWTRLFSQAEAWTNEKATRSAEVKARLAYLGGIINSPNKTAPRGVTPATAKAEFDALKKEDEQLNAEYGTIAHRPGAITKVLKWSGISLAIVGLIGWYAVKQSS